MSVANRSHLSIGDVLSLLRKEFPDVTISKIRFLESQGLVNPERSPSGYRKFYEDDVERLRWVLRQQREHFLPLKVIRDRLGSDDDVAPDAVAACVASSVPPEDVGAVTASVDEPPAASPPEPTPPPPPTPGPEPSSALPPRQTPPPAPPPPPPAPQEPGPAAEPPLPARAAALTGASLTLEELASASGLTEPTAASLEGFGLIGSLEVAGIRYYDEESLAVARLVADFGRYGIEPRHLRLYHNAVDREMGLVEQVITPLLRQRNPESRQRAVEAADELTRLGQGLRAALVRQALRRQLGH